MLVKAVLIIEYKSVQGPWKSDLVREPTWDRIEAAVRRLDRCLFPFLSFYLKAFPDEGGLPDLDLVGGNGEYGFMAYRDGCRKLAYFDSNRSSHYVDIWVSDQGTSMPEYELCSDLERTLSIIRYFCETGGLHPDADWVGWPISAILR